MSKKTVKKSIFSYILLALLIFGVIYFFTVLNKKVNDLTYSELMKAMDNKEITEMTITPNNNAGIYELTGKMKDYDDNESFSASAPLADETIKEIYEGRKNYGFEVIDLGKDVPKEVIVEEAIKREAAVIALSALMTTTMQ